ncbi:MAG: hypothetical protein H0X04_06170 [Chthoniobacterales bacterium]|nr:hypothetical protein [Chthoniobacterales bacterium]
MTWDEVEKTSKKRDANLLVFRTDDTLQRVEKFGDLFAPMNELKQKLPKKWEL